MQLVCVFCGKVFDDVNEAYLHPKHCPARTRKKVEVMLMVKQGSGGAVAWKK